MPTGSFTGSPDTYERQGTTSLTGSGAPSQPRYTGTWDVGPTGTWGGATGGPMSTATAGGSGYTSPATSPGAGQFSSPQGPSAYAPGPISQYPNSIYGPLSPASMANQLANTMYGPQQQILADQLARQQSQLGMVGMDADYKTNALYRDNDLAKQLLGLDKQGLGIDQGLTKTQLANLEKLRGILGQQRDLAGDTKTLNTAEAKDIAQRKTFDLRSALTARGAYNTVANERGSGRINRDLLYQLGGINDQYRGTMMGLDEKGIGYDNQQAQLNARLANIGLDYQRLGISEQQLANSLSDGLQQIGLSSQTSINALMDAMSGTNMQSAQLAGTILNEIINLSGLPPDVIANLQAAMGTSQYTATMPQGKSMKR